MRKNISYAEVLIVICLVAATVAIWKYVETLNISTETSDSKATVSYPAPTKIPTEVIVEEQKLCFIIKTEKGDIKGELYPDVAPNTVLNFVTLANEGFYDGLTFHRVEPGFVIQGGDPTGTGGGGPEYTIPPEFNDKKHILGTLAMARASDPDSAGSQFYICLGTFPHLDGKYTIFGQVTEGIEVVQEIRIGDKFSAIEIEGNLPPELQQREVEKIIISDEGKK